MSKKYKCSYKSSLCSKVFDDILVNIWAQTWMKLATHTFSIQKYFFRINLKI
jgi:hypothetical protein